MAKLSPGAVVLIVVAVVAGCGSILDVSLSTDEGTPDVRGGRGGTTHRGGTTSGGPSGAGGEAGEGGTSGTAGDGGTTGGAPSTGGRNTGGTGATSGGTAGDGGAGAAGGPEWPRDGDPCATAGALSCVEPALTGRLMCDGGRWEPVEPCREGDMGPTLCDRRTGTCGRQICDGPGPVPGVFPCTTSQQYRLVCGPDLVTSEKVDCLFGCNGIPSNQCMGRAADQFVVHTAFDGGSRDPKWPTPFIPVCWTEPNDPQLAGVRDAIQFAVNSTWGRPTALTFTGWGECSSTRARVELRFVDDCRGELARMPRIGYPGPGQSLAIELCKSYYDAAKPEPVEVPPDRLRHVALHVFGHVVGLADVEYQRGTSDVMMPALDLPGYPTSQLTPSAIGWIRTEYGAKPPRSLVTPDGQCVSYNAEVLAVGPCTGDSSQRWDLFLDGTLHHPNSLTCLKPGAGSVEYVRDCPGDRSQYVRLSNRVSWHTFGDRCVTVDQFSEWPLQTIPCQAGPPDAQSFKFEFETGSVRIRAANGECVLAPPLVYPPPSPKPVLRACDDRWAILSFDFFEAFAGRLVNSGFFLTALSKGLELNNGDSPEVQTFWISGVFLFGTQSPYDGLTLTRQKDGTPKLSTLPLPQSPMPNQIFDYHF